MNDGITIVKATGEREVFDPQKLHNSLRKAGAGEETTNRIIDQIVSGLKDGDTTKEIYIRAFDLLKQENVPKVTARYSLRNAIMDLGPSGFPFEQFVAQIFQAKGFETTTDFIAQGHCAEHEIDIVAWNPEKLIMVEAKFHNIFGIKSDLKVALYVKARWEDLADQEFDFGRKRKLDEGWLITNTKFSEAAIKYANCRGMKLVGWNYPEDGSLQDLIEEARLHPITCLTSINPSDEKLLMAAGIVLCKQAKDNPDVVLQTGLNKNKLDKMLEEIEIISN
jgi:hypothetical protein